MAYIALYRKYRPKTFEDIIGQDHITSTLINQIKLNRTSHAYLFCGIRGTGKTSAAKVFAKALNCTNSAGAEPCGVCGCCVAQDNDAAADVIEIDAASNRGIEEIRQIRESVKYRPVTCKYKVYIIDEAHMLTAEAFNALLKTLEEPAEYVVFILATTEPHKLPQTIISRTQRYDFKRLRTQDVQNHILKICKKENINITPKAAYNIAVLSEGALRDALSILDKCASYASDREVSEELVNFITGRADDETIFAIVQSTFYGDIEGLLSALNSAQGSGKDILTVLDSIIAFIREIIICKNSEEAEKMLNRSEKTLENMKALSLSLTAKELIKGLDLLLEAQSRIAFAQTPIYVLECALMLIASSKDISGGQISPAVKTPQEDVKPKPQPVRQDSYMSPAIKPDDIKSAEVKSNNAKPFENKKSDITSAKKPVKSNKELKDKLTAKLYEKYPLIAIGVEKADMLLSNNELTISAEEYVYSMICEDKKHKDYIVSSVREILGTNDAIVNITVKNDVIKQAKEAFGDILKIEE
ncbi:MAG: DNA polymerase III subunit gamma/tau [Eubacteriaceae bacterium]|nr:DNA polymerase III subunit gamma/tau [Eubacteriaceae bacterium]